MEKNLKKLQATVRGGGKLVTHRALFSEDASKLYIIQSSCVLSYSTSSCLLISRFFTPDAVPIANAHVKSSSEILVFTAAGTLLHVNPATNKILKTCQVNMNIKGWNPISTFTNFAYPSGDNPHPHFLALGYPEDAVLPVLHSVSTEEVPFEYPLVIKLCWSMVPTQHSFAMSPDGRFVVAIQETALFCKDMTNMEHCAWHSSGTRKFTCVAVHPTSEFVCATGDDSGRILIWNNVLTQRSPAKTVFHWHTLPVIDLIFTPEGSQMISGGGECTMLKWDVSDVTNKRTLPRMGLPIRHISCAGNAEMIAVSHADNCVQLVDSYNSIIGIVRNFTQAYVPNEGEQEESGVISRANVFPAGVHVDPNNGSLVVNGRPGYLQCYDFKQDRQIYAIDVAHQNYVTSEREKPIPNAEVLHVGFSKSGAWMGTVEGRIIPAGKGNHATELKLKFWKMSKEKGKWVLSTCVEYPHERVVKSVKFRPVAEKEDELVCVSSGDAAFKVWGLAEVVSVHGNVEHWYLEHNRNYKDMMAGPVEFSSDGSLLAATFGRSVTLWDSTDGNCSFRFSLCHTRLTEDITSVDFGHNVNSHLILCSSQSNVFVWDVITASLLWVAPVKVQSMAIDPLSSLAAAVTADLHLFFFNLDCPEPLAAHKYISKSAVVSSVFIPNQKMMEDVGLKSTFVCINSSNEVIAMLPKARAKDLRRTRKGKVIRIGDGKEALTPFAEMIAETTVSDVGHRSADRMQAYAGQRAHSILREIMDASPHTMPSATYYCTQLLRAVSKPLTEADRLEAIEKLVRMSQRKKSRDLSDENGRSEDPDVSILLENINECGNSDNSCYSYNSNSNIEDCGVLAGKEIDLDEAAHGPTDWIEFVFKK